MTASASASKIIIQLTIPTKHSAEKERVQWSPLVRSRHCGQLIHALFPLTPVSGELTRLLCTCSTVGKCSAAELHVQTLCGISGLKCLAKCSETGLECGIFLLQVPEWRGLPSHPDDNCETSAFHLVHHSFSRQYVDYRALQTSQTAEPGRSRDFLHGFCYCHLFRLKKYKLRINVKKSLKSLAEEMPVHVSQTDIFCVESDYNKVWFVSISPLGTLSSVKIPKQAPFGSRWSQ